MKRKNEWRVITLSVILCIIISVMIFYVGGMFPGQPRIFMFSDQYYQYVHTINMFIRRLLNGEVLDYSFEMGLGMPAESIYTGYCLSPFNILFYLVKDIDTASFIITVAKLAVAAGMFSLMAVRILKTDDFACVLFALFYALGGYSVNFASCMVFLDGLYVLPILVYCIHEFIDAGKWKLLCFMYTYIFIVQIYTGYIVGIFTAVIFLTMLMIKYGSDRKGSVRIAIRYGCVVLIAFLLSAAIILPEVIGILKYSQSDSNMFEGLRSHFLGLIGAFFAGNTMGIYNTFPAVYSGLPVFFLTPLFFLRRDISKKYRIGVGAILAFLLLCTLWGPAYLFMHVFNTPDGHAYRFSYFWTFVLVFISLWTYMSIRDSKKDRKYFFLCGACACLIYGGLLFLQERVLQGEGVLSGLLWMINAVFFLAYGYLFGKKKESKAARITLTAVFAFELFVNGYFMVSGMEEDSLVRTKTYYDLWQEQTKGAVEVIDQKETEDPHAFYRICYQNAPIDNISMLFGYRGLGYFASIENVKLRKTMTGLGYASSPRFLLDYGSTPVMRMLLGQRYYIQVADPRGDHPEYYAVTELPETLGLGYMVSEELTDYDIFESTDPFANQERLVSAMCGRQVDLYEPIDHPLNIQQDGVQVAYTENGFSLTKETDDIGYVNYTIQDDSDKTAYAYFSLWGMSAQDLNSPIILSRIDRGCAFSQSYLTMPHILPLDREDNGEYQVSIVMNAGSMQSVTYENQFFVVYDEQAKSDVYRELKQHEYEIEHFTDSKITGHVEVPEDKMLLFTTIPYDEYWHAYVDGTEAMIKPVLNGTFIAISMNTGAHEITFEYQNPWKYRGIAVTVAGLLVMMVLSLLESNCRKKQ